MFAVIPRLSFCREPLLLITYRSRTVASHSSICTNFAFRFVDAWGLRPDEVSLHFCFWIRPGLSAFALDNSKTSTTTASCKVVYYCFELVTFMFSFCLSYFFREYLSLEIPMFSEWFVHFTSLLSLSLSLLTSYYSYRYTLYFTPWATFGISFSLFPLQKQIPDDIYGFASNGIIHCDQDLHTI